MTKAEASPGIRRLIDGWAQAIRAHDLDGVMSFYAPATVSSEVDPPLRYAGMALKRHAWAEFFEAHAGDIDYEVTELDVTKQGDVACVRSLNHVTGKNADGVDNDVWVRWTACLRKFSGEWLVVHDHVSAPAQLHGERAARDPRSS
jgi:ketosteroid isomerase-like protein